MARDHLSDQDIQVIGAFISPVNDAYQKPNLIAAKHRTAMCQAALQNSSWIQLDTWESEQASWQLTVEVLASVKKRLTASGLDGVDVMLVSGADLVLSFAVPDLWSVSDQERIAGDFGLVVLERSGSDISEYILANPILYKHRKNIFIVKQHVFNDVSSTKVRLFVARGMSIRYLVADAVVEYIDHHRLYR